MNSISRRRLLIDLGFAGCALALVAGFSTFLGGKPASQPSGTANSPKPHPPKFMPTDSGPGTAACGPRPAPAGPIPRLTGRSAAVPPQTMPPKRTAPL